MRIYACRTNHFENPVGYDLPGLRVSWKVDGTDACAQKSARVIVRTGSETLYDSGDAALDSLSTPLPVALLPRTRYEWKVSVEADNGDRAESGWNVFETSKLDEPWEAQWIGSPLGKDVPVIARRRFTLERMPENARIYVTGVGLYHLVLNGKPVSDERFLPGCTDYDEWLQYQTFDLSAHLKTGENELRVYLGDGWYKGRMLDGKDNYGDHYALLAELRMDGQVVATGEGWEIAPSPYTFSDIYDGEVFDPSVAENWQAAVLLPDEKHTLVPRVGVPVRVQQTLPAAELIRTPKDEYVLDFGQNMAGFVRFRCAAPAGTRVHLQFGEILQDGCFYNDNLRSAKAEFTYISDGKERVVEPLFTWFGFRFAKVEGIEPVPADFTACVVHSDLEETGFIKTGMPKVDRLIQNARWGQRSNYLDVPTDCPQRDERLGWTADTQVFAGTACWFTDAYAFLSKYVRDMANEQKTLNGSVPVVIPSFGMKGSSSVWSDAATFIPWTLYTYFGDPAILRDQYESMRSWVDCIRCTDMENGNRYLWLTGFQFGDWLGLDNEGTDPDNRRGGTDDYYIASAFYYWSAHLVAESARILGYETDAARYTLLADRILAAIRAEYFSPTGRLAVTTQTAYVLALQFGLFPPETSRRTIDALAHKLQLADVHLRTGFVGTAYLCRVLSANGLHDLAVRLLLNEDYPSWLYAVNMGATTIWERWNSVLPDGHLSGIGMNSLNHYAYGSIVDWMFRYLGGMEPVESAPGFRKARIAPKPHPRMPKLDMRYDSACGVYRVSWELRRDGSFTLDVEVPFGAEAELVLPNKNGKPIRLKAGRTHYDYVPDVPFFPPLTVDTALCELLNLPEAISAFERCGFDPMKVPAAERGQSLRQLMRFYGSDELLGKFESAFAAAQA